MTHHIYPYEGNGAFIFASYAHKDKERVFPIIEKLQGAGYRTWYDQGIDPGTEWDENIARHILGCSFFIAFISQSYLESDNCKDELNFARELSKDRVLIYLEEVTLPAGMQMRLGRQQAIYYETYLDNMQMFYNTLFKSNGINRCQGQGKESAVEESEAVDEQIHSTKRLIELAKEGNVTAQVKLGICYAFGMGVEQDAGKAVELFQIAAKKGDPQAQENLGVCYRDGLGVDCDMEKAVHWFQEAAEQGQAEAQNNLGQCYLQGKGIKQNYLKAAECFLKSAEQGNAFAQINLGGCYLKGTGVPKDAGQAVAWFTKAAEQGDVNACFNLGLCYENGWGVDSDYKTAAKWYKMAAERGDSKAKE